MIVVEVISLCACFIVIVSVPVFLISIASMLPTGFGVGRT